jgi:hypothetical protein
MLGHHDKGKQNHSKNTRPYFEPPIFRTFLEGSQRLHPTFVIFVLVVTVVIIPADE